ncbi:MAG TPA: hypothetical protein VKV26_04205 [Dehalococcoidia bacterium]|nr:hypothetical protein [Dehalococcoidia bacterium]
MEYLIGTSKGVFCTSGGDTREVEGLQGHSVRALAQVGGALFAGTKDGIFRSADGGKSWAQAGVAGREIWDIVPAPGDTQTIFAGAQPAGLFRSTDGGRSWGEVESFAKIPGAEKWCVPTTPPSGGRARTVTLDQKNPERWWVGVEVGGVARTADAGKSWSVSLPNNNPDIHVMVSQPSRPDTVFATTGYGRLQGVAEQIEGNAGLFRSRDGGANWEYLWQGRLPRYTRPLVIDPRNEALTVACAPTAFASYKDEGGAQAKLYRSDDAGDSWRNLGDAAHTPSAACLLGVAVGERPGEVLVTTDTGELWNVTPEARWTLLASGLPPAWSVLAV